jgi:hypothetical protein
MDPNDFGGFPFADSIESSYPAVPLLFKEILRAVGSPLVSTRYADLNTLVAQLP